jgi:hypothetical protein
MAKYYFGNVYYEKPRWHKIKLKHKSRLVFKAAIGNLKMFPGKQVIICIDRGYNGPAHQL